MRVYEGKLHATDGVRKSLHHGAKGVSVVKRDAGAESETAVSRMIRRCLGWAVGCALARVFFGSTWIFGVRERLIEDS